MCPILLSSFISFYLPLQELHRLDAALSIGIASYVAVATLWGDNRLAGQIIE
jgi:hypothetical protein